MAAFSADIRQLLGLHPSDDGLSKHILSLSTLASSSASTQPEVTPYPDVVYFNYYPLGISLQFKPVNGYKPKPGMRREELGEDDLVLDGVDLYNVPNPEQRTTPSQAKSTYVTYPIPSFTLSLTLIPGKSRPSSLTVNSNTTGKEFVTSLGEPDRKGGGAGPSTGSIGIWCEWSKDGIMVEFGGDESRGPQAWERGKDAIWKTISIFYPQDS